MEISTAQLEREVKHRIQARLEKDEAYHLLKKMVGEMNIDEIRNSTQKTIDTGFPFIILSLGIIKDLSDIPTVGFSAPITSFIVGIIVWIWIRGKFKFGQKMLLRWAIKWLIAVCIADAVPIISMVPWTSIYIVVAHKRHTTFVRLLFATLEVLKGHHADVVRQINRARESHLLQEAVAGMAYVHRYKKSRRQELMYT